MESLQDREETIDEQRRIIVEARRHCGPVPVAEIE
jgi:hypothetical protein